MKDLGAVFSGQGSQYPGMYKELVSIYPDSKKIFKQASEICNLDLIEICSNEPEKILKETRKAQLSTVLYSIALYKFYLEEYGILPKFFAGHSVGEYSALIAAGIIDFEDGIRLVNRRGELMQGLRTNGGMLAVTNSDILNIEEYCQEHNSPGKEIVISNYNSNIQTILSGTNEQIEKAQTYYNKQNVPTKRLSVSGGFHSPLMKTIEDEFGKELQQCKFNLNGSIIFSNIDAKEYRNEEEIKLKLKLQLSQPVLWNDIMHALRRKQVETILEFGPKKTLSNLLQTISEIEAYSFSKDQERVREVLVEKYSPSKNVQNLIERCLTIIACTCNYNNDIDDYQKEVIEIGKKLRQLGKNYNVEGIDESVIKNIIDYLIRILEGKKISVDEQKKWLLKLESDTSNIHLKELLKNEIKGLFS